MNDWVDQLALEAEDDGGEGIEGQREEAHELEHDLVSGQRRIVDAGRM